MVAANTAADVLIDALCDLGVESLFGLPGDGINGLVEALGIRQGSVYG
jgi:pyruvate dehydrogenase (quinone)